MQPARGAPFEGPHQRRQQNDLLKGAVVRVEAVVQQVVHDDGAAGALRDHVPGPGEVVAGLLQALLQHFAVDAEVLDRGARPGAEAVAGQVIGEHRVAQFQHMGDQMPVKPHMVEIPVADQHRAAGHRGPPAVHADGMAGGLEVAEAVLQVRHLGAEVQAVILRVAPAHLVQGIERLPVERPPGAGDFFAGERKRHGVWAKLKMGLDDRP